MECQGHLTSKKGKPPCKRSADLQCRSCGFAVCYLHSNYVCECPVSMHQRRGLELSTHGVL